MANDESGVATSGDVQAVNIATDSEQFIRSQVKNDGKKLKKFQLSYIFGLNVYKPSSGASHVV